MYNSTLTAVHCCTSLWAGWCFSCFCFTFIVAHACTSFLSLSLTSSLCCAFYFLRRATSGMLLDLLCFDGIVTSSCLCALIECVRQPVTKYPVFGHLQEALIWVNQTRSIYRYWFCLSVVCLHAQELYTHKQVARLFKFIARCWKSYHCQQSLGSGVVVAMVYLFNDTRGIFPLWRS